MFAARHLRRWAPTRFARPRCPGALTQAHPQAVRNHREGEPLGHGTFRFVELDLKVAGDHRHGAL